MSLNGGCYDRGTEEVRSDSMVLTSYIKWCDVLNCGCDVTYRAHDVIHIVAVMSILWV